MHYESKYTWGFGTGKVIFIWNRQGRSFGIAWMGFWRISVQGFEVYQAATVGGCHFRYGSSICKERKDFLKIASHLRATRSTFRLLEHEGAWGWRDQYGLGYVNPCRPVKELDLYLVRNGEPMKGSTGKKWQPVTPKTFISLLSRALLLSHRNTGDLTSEDVCQFSLRPMLNLNWQHQCQNQSLELAVFQQRSLWSFHEPVQ